MARKTKRPEPGRNEAQAAAARARRGSGAAGLHGDRRTKRLRDRSARERAARQEAMS